MTTLPNDLRNQANGLGQHTPRTEAEMILDAVRDGVLAGVGTLVGDRIDAGVTNLTSAVGATGALTGAYYYSFTFVSPLGETAPWPGTPVVVNPAAQRVNLTNIPLGPAGTTARRIYRTPAVSGNIDPKDYRFLTEIADNTTTTYTDNTVDGSLGDPVNWAATNRGQLTDGSNVVMTASDQSTSVGFEAFGTNAGYASSAFGYRTLYSNTTGRRNLAMGVYSLTSLTTGYENTAGGVHSLNNLIDGIGWTVFGYGAGQNSAGTVTGKNFGTVMGHRAYQNGGGGSVTIYGSLAGADANTADGLICFGFAAGRRASASREVYIDNQDRTTNANEKNAGLIYGKTEGTVAAQILHLNAQTRIGAGDAPVVGGLPAAAAGLKGYRGYVTDSTVAYVSANVGATVVGGGANTVPVFCNGTNWVIG